MINIVIPVFNVEKYIKRCLDSVINQGCKEFRAIVVDDGSTDNCGAICDEYAEKDDRILVFHKSNGGLASAVRYGIEKSPKCDYFMFLDGDDFFETDAVLSVNEIIKENPDLVVFDYFVTEEDGRILKAVTSNVNVGLNTGDIYNEIKNGYVSTSNVAPARWNKAYRYEIAKSALEYYSNEVTVAEDMLFTTVSLFNSKSLYYINKSLIHYCQNSDSMTHKFKESYFSSYKIVYGKLNEYFNGGKKADEIFFQNIKTLVQDMILSNTTKKEKKLMLKKIILDEQFLLLKGRYRPQSTRNKILFNLIKNGRYNLLKILTKINNN